MIPSALPAIEADFAISVAACESMDVTVGTDTTFIFETADGMLVTMIGRGFQYDAQRRNVVAGTLKAVFIFDRATGTTLAELQNLSVDMADPIAAKRALAA